MDVDTFWRFFNAAIAFAAIVMLLVGAHGVWDHMSPRVRMVTTGLVFILVAVAGSSIRNAIMGDRPPTIWTPFITAGTLIICGAHLLTPMVITQQEHDDRHQA